MKYSDVTITPVYEIDCRVCGMAVWPDDRFLTFSAALDAKLAHISEHESRQFS
jgi:hypothetical protein